MEVRDYVRKDLPEVVKIANAAWRPIRRMTRQKLGEEISNILHPGGDAVSKGIEVAGQIESGEYAVKVCVDSGCVVGFITFKITGEIGEICNNAALPDSGLKGIGQCMYRAVLDAMRLAGVRVVMVSTGLDEAHAPARRAYERAGFHRRLESVTYYLNLKNGNEA